MAKSLKTLLVNEKPEVVAKANKKAKVIVTQEVTKKPTVKSLQEQVDNLSTQLGYANTKAVELIEDVKNLQLALLDKDEDVKFLESRLKIVTDTIEEIEGMSPWQFFKYKLGL